jgi:hypothetical protein
MEIDGWKYYNHAAIPTCAPHEEPNLEPIINGAIWRIGGHPLMARWTSDWNFGEESEWWYLIRKGPFNIDELSKKSKKSIKKSLELCEVKNIKFKDYAEQIFQVYTEANTRYIKQDNKLSNLEFMDFYNSFDESVDIWAAFSKETGRMIGYKVCKVYLSYVDLLISKYSPDYLKLRVSDALTYTVLDYYLNNKNKYYVYSGSRSINHVTNVQEYYQEHFNFEKIYCKLHIKYRFLFGILIKIIYPFRKIINKLDVNTFAHQVNAILKMEEIKRSFDSVKPNIK